MFSERKFCVQTFTLSRLHHFHSCVNATIYYKQAMPSKKKRNQTKKARESKKRHAPSTNSSEEEGVLSPMEENAILDHIEGNIEAQSPQRRPERTPEEQAKLQESISRLEMLKIKISSIELDIDMQKHRIRRIYCAQRRRS